MEVSAACGATYFVARWLAGRRVDGDIKHEVIAKRMHSYPCTASMEWDDELGDTPMHIAGQAHYEILRQLGKEPGEAPRPVVSPAGVVLPEPPRGGESLENIERAKEAILAMLAERGSLGTEELGRIKGVSPAAAYSALLLLKKAGRVEVEGQSIKAIASPGT